MASPRKFVVMVGDEDSGKSCLFGVDQVDVEVTGGGQCRLVLHDTQGDAAFDSVRPIGYMHADMFLVCFAIDSPDSLRNAQRWWVPEVRRFCPNVPVVLVGTKNDLRNDPATISELSKIDQRPVSVEDGHRMAHEVGAFCYVECSARTREGIKQLVQVAAKLPIVPKASSKAGRERYKTCVVM